MEVAIIVTSLSIATLRVASGVRVGSLAAVTPVNADLGQSRREPTGVAAIVRIEIMIAVISVPYSVAIAVSEPAASSIAGKVFG